MTPRLVEFIRLLRAQGIPLSLAEGLDALHSVNAVGVQDRELLRLTLRTTLVKAQQDVPLFDTLFEQFFTIPRPRRRRRGQSPAPGSQGLGTRPTPQPNGVPQAPTRPPLTPQNHPAAQATPDPPPEADEADETEASEAEMLQTLAELEHAWQEHVARPASSPQERLALRAETPALSTRLDRPFPPDQLAAMYREVERLALRLLTRQALRTRRAQHGRFDIRRTVLRGLRSGTEVPFTLAYRRRKPTKLRLIVLCDVSGSVWQVSTFLLKLVHTLQAAFASVRSLVFVNSAVEVTELFRRMRFPDDLEQLRRYPQLNLFGFSDFGRVFYQFADDCVAELRPNTVVLILGDARNNHFDPQAWALGEVRQHCRRIIWLNPEPRREWDTDDSVLAEYAPYCERVLECWTLEHLVQAADALLQP